MFRAVGNRCAVDFSELDLPISDEEILNVLALAGFRSVAVDVVQLVRSCLGVSQYVRGTQVAFAPGIVDCSTLIKWVYAQRGIWIPRRTIQQIEYGESVGLSDIKAGDALFVTGSFNWYRDDPRQSVGHVGMATGEGTIVHAATKGVGVIERSIDHFLSSAELRGIRRFIANPSRVVTLETPPEREVETSDDIRWIVLMLAHK